MRRMTIPGRVIESTMTEKKQWILRVALQDGETSLVCQRCGHDLPEVPADLVLVIVKRKVAGYCSKSCYDIMTSEVSVWESVFGRRGGL